MQALVTVEANLSNLWMWDRTANMYNAGTARVDAETTAAVEGVRFHNQCSTVRIETGGVVVIASSGSTNIGGPYIFETNAAFISVDDSTNRYSEHISFIGPDSLVIESGTLPPPTCCCWPEIPI